MFSVEVSRRAEKFIDKLPKELSKKIFASIESLKDEQFPRGAIKLKGEVNVFRIRVGDYRILYEVYADRSLVLVINVDNRSRVYDNL